MSERFAGANRQTQGLHSKIPNLKLRIPEKQEPRLQAGGCQLARGKRENSEPASAHSLKLTLKLRGTEPPPNLRASRKRASKLGNDSLKFPEIGTPKLRGTGPSKPPRNDILKSRNRNSAFPKPGIRLQTRAPKFPTPRRAARWNLRGQVRHGISGRPRRRRRRRGSFGRSKSRPRGERTAETRDGTFALRSTAPHFPRRQFRPQRLSHSYTIGFTNKSSISVFFGILMSSQNRLAAPEFRPLFAVKISLRSKPALLDSRPL